MCTIIGYGPQVVHHQVDKTNMSTKDVMEGNKWRVQENCIGSLYYLRSSCREQNPFYLN